MFPGSLVTEEKVLKKRKGREDEKELRIYTRSLGVPLWSMRGAEAGSQEVTATEVLTRSHGGQCKVKEKHRVTLWAQAGDRTHDIWKTERYYLSENDHKKNGKIPEEGAAWGGNHPHSKLKGRWGKNFCNLKGKWFFKKKKIYKISPLEGMETGFIFLNFSLSIGIFSSVSIWPCVKHLFTGDFRL